MASSSSAPPPHLEFSLVPNFFVSYPPLATSQPDKKAWTQPHFGLLPSAAPGPPGLGGAAAASSAGAVSWPRMPRILRSLNTTADSSTTSYKLIFYSRHGEGFHNIGEATYGTEEWDAHWSLLDGDGKGNVWADSELSPRGREQVDAVGRMWREWAMPRALADRLLAAAEEEEAGEEADTLDKTVTDLLPPNCPGIPFPHAIYTSPLRRCLDTARRIYGAVSAAQDKKFAPIVKEGLRERVTNHTCDRRSSRTAIVERFPEVVVGNEIAEEDPMWRADAEETMAEIVVRMQACLERIWAEAQGKGVDVLAIVSHSQALAAFLEVVGEEVFLVRESTTMAFLVKAEEV